MRLLVAQTSCNKETLKKKVTYVPLLHDQMVKSGIGYLGIVSTNWAGAFEGAVGVALLRVREGEISHFIVPGLHMEGGGPIPGSKRHCHHLPLKRALMLCVSESTGTWSRHAKDIVPTRFIEEETPKASKWMKQVAFL